MMEAAAQIDLFPGAGSAEPDAPPPPRLQLEPFQRRFIQRAFATTTLTAALSVPRGNGKSTLAGHILERCLTPGDPFNIPGREYVLLAASIEQARFVFNPLREWLEYGQPGEFRFIDSIRQLGATHLRTRTKLKVVSSDGNKAMGLSRVPLVIADEPGSWTASGGRRMFDALTTAQGKPDSKLRVIFIGTLAPALSGWWHNLIAAGSGDGIYVQALIGEAAKWDRVSEIKRVNPLIKRYPESLDTLKLEVKRAKRDPRLKPQFISYRLNRPTADETKVLLTVSEFEDACNRPVAERDGQPFIGVDLGQGRSWSAAVAIWPSGRIEALAVAPGVPAIAEQERRDQTEAGAYSALVETGRLLVADGLRVPPPAMLWAVILEQWGQPRIVVCDRFRKPELEDAGVAPLEPRVWQWSSAAADIRSLRKLMADGGASIAEASRPLIGESLRVAEVKNDESGNCRLVKATHHQTARDDVAAALTLAAGAHDRGAAGPGIRWADAVMG